MDVIFKDIADRLKAQLGADLELVDLEQGQIDKNEDNSDLILPAIFIGFEDITYTDKGRLDQNGTCLINFRIVQKTYEETNNKSENQAQALDKINYLKRVHKELQGFDGHYHNHLMRRNLKQEIRPDGLLVFNMKYVCNITDAFADNIDGKPTKTFIGGMNLKGEIKTNLD